MKVFSTLMFVVATAACGPAAQVTAPTPTRPPPPKGRWEKKLEQTHAGLESSAPEVKQGHLKPLGTRAAPFAVFIARMHRKIHELWGFGFIEELDRKPQSNPMNDRKLEVTLEIILKSDGTLDRTTIIRPSGVLVFDVAAIDVVQNAGPFGTPPEAIRSANGKIYLHWAFHRDERQCSPYFADPFILDDPGPDQGRGLPDPANAIAERRDGATEGGMAQPVKNAEGAADGAARASIHGPDPFAPEAQLAGVRWADAFESGKIDVLVAASGLPFSWRGNQVASTPDTLAKAWRAIVEETPVRTVKEWKVMSAAAYRTVFGRLPKNDEDGTDRIYLVAHVGEDWVTSDLRPAGSGRY